FFNRVYAHILDNDGPEDGFTYRGRGIFQLTGKSNYKRYGGLAGLDLVGNPDLANDPKNAAELAVVYMMDHCAQGAGFEQMKLAVGRSTADINARKNQRFSEFLASGEFNA
ncbi:MAG TPA: glycoside hydrolase family 19 protein, partial [Stellaceae bacterium]|nr:glycoside hydrolase family 19 protein [Stellaceae bacterium]